MNCGLSRTLTALLAAGLLLSGALSSAGSKKLQDPAGELRAGIERSVADPTRAAAMLSAVDDIESLVGELDRLVADERASLAALLRDHGSSREAVDTSLAEFNARREALARRVLAAHAGLKAQATAAEWKKLRGLEMDMVMVAATRSLGQTESSGTEG